MRLSMLPGAIMLAAFPAFAPASALDRQDIQGMWRQPGNGPLVQVYSCQGGGICAKVASTADPDLKDVKNPEPSLRSRPVAGLVIWQHPKESGDLQWIGSSYNIADGGTYYGTMHLTSSTTLDLSVCDLNAMRCDDQTWTKAGPQGATPNVSSVVIKSPGAPTAPAASAPAAPVQAVAARAVAAPAPVAPAAPVQAIAARAVAAPAPVAPAAPVQAVAPRSVAAPAPATSAAPVQAVAARAVVAPAPVAPAAPAPTAATHTAAVQAAAAPLQGAPKPAAAKPKAPAVKVAETPKVSAAPVVEKPKEVPERPRDPNGYEELPHIHLAR
jgi:uncharacterized protein (DUF2147 family)